MPAFIIHKDGVYNIFSTIVDAPYFVSGLTLEQIEEYTEKESGLEGLRYLPERLARAHETGCSGMTWTLDEVIQSNRAGPKESKLSRKRFIETYLTIKP